MTTQGTKRSAGDGPSTSHDTSTQTSKQPRLLSGERGETETMKEAKLIMEQVQNKLKDVRHSDTNSKFIDYIRTTISNLATAKNKITVGVFGETGAGKSSLINAILDENELLPCKDISACTSVITRVEANTKDSNYTAEVEFISKQEWEEELKELLQVLCSKDNEESDEKMVTVANDKIQALYGEDGVGKSFNELMKAKHFSDIPEFLRSTKKTISFRKASELSTAISCYIENDDSSPGGYYWPIVKTVTIKVPNCKDFLEHIVLVDLPGTGDFNKSRDEMWKTSLRGCSTVWIVTEIKRAASRKEPWEILTSSIRDMAHSGECSSLVFICTKTDDINPQAYMRSSKLKEEDLDEFGGDQDSCLDKKKRACILHRNHKAKEQVKKVFKKQSEFKKHFTEREDFFQVFTVSSHEFHQTSTPVLRPKHTEIPEMKELLKRLNDTHSKKVVRDYVSRGKGILSLIQGANCKDGNMVEDKSKLSERLEKLLRDDLEIIHPYLEQLFKDLEESLSNGAIQSEDSCVETAMKKVIAPPHKDGRGYHRTLKALCKNGGFFRSKEGVETDLNTCLADVMYGHIDEKFKNYFPNSGKTGLSVGEEVDKFSIISNSVREEFKHSPVKHYLTFLEIEGNKLKEELKQNILEKKRKIYASLTESIKTTMNPCYEDAADISGKGSMKLMQEMLVKHIRSSKGKMFQQAKEKMLKQFKKLMTFVELELKNKLKDSMAHSLINSTPVPDVSEQLDRMEILLLDRSRV